MKIHGHEIGSSGHDSSGPGIVRKYLADDGDIDTASVATRMSWMADRVTTQVEDIAYGMLGILDINMTLQYGEGAKGDISDRSY